MQGTQANLSSLCRNGIKYTVAGFKRFYHFSTWLMLLFANRLGIPVQEHG